MSPSLGLEFRRRIVDSDMAAPGSAWAHNLSNRGGLRQLQGLFLEPCFAVGRSAAMCHANLLCIPKDHEALQLPIPFEKGKRGYKKV